MYLPNRFSYTVAYTNKVVIEQISCVFRILNANIITNYLCYVFYFPIFCVNDTTDNAPSMLSIVFHSIEFMLKILSLSLSNLAIEKISELCIKILWDFILTVKCEIILHRLCSLYRLYSLFYILHRLYSYFVCYLDYTVHFV